MNHEATSPARAPITAPFDPLILLQDGESRRLQVVCLPGAGASITSLMELTGALDRERTVYGLQPRGIETGEDPHASVEEAAKCNLAALTRVGLASGFHLIGHSHGGAIAFEMALRMQDAGRPPQSLTLIDSRPPTAAAAPPPRTLTDAEILADFVDALRRTFEGRLFMDTNHAHEASIDRALPRMREAMIAAGILSPRSHPHVLHGPYATYATARRMVYRPDSSYRGPGRLVLVRDANRTVEADLERQRDYAGRWRTNVTNLVIWQGQGNHYSILRPPHVDGLAGWWRELATDA